MVDDEEEQQQPSQHQREELPEGLERPYEQGRKIEVSAADAVQIDAGLDLDDLAAQLRGLSSS